MLGLVNDIFQNVLKSRGGPKSRRLALNILNVALSRGDATLYLEDGIVLEAPSAFARSRQTGLTTSCDCRP